MTWRTRPSSWCTARRTPVRGRVSHWWSSWPRGSGRTATTAQVGGDWYDSFVLPGGNTALVIGDVTGHDLDAAIAMSQLRSMLRGIAVDREEPPAEVLRRLDLANHSTPPPAIRHRC
ncbi:PP2C family protein-serine/threonine phosphatase [Streptomyces sp. NPDC059906]|uniref:PP2C family protein-serine/threonine phosphatase n=1 Tax=Streptomyces sp. NPDC059906 TaxID=3346997 RepID=UPI0036502036